MKIKQSVLEILSGSVVCSENTARIIGQLERKSYLAVDKVLAAVGGKWNKRAKAHLWPNGTSAQDVIDAVLLHGEVTTAREVGFFETPVELAKQLVEMAEVRPGDTVLEPSAGKGRIVKALNDAGALVYAIERDEARRIYLKELPSGARPLHVSNEIDDFMNDQVHSGSSRYDRVVMNPPFCKVGLGDHLDHVRHAYAMLVCGGILVSVLPCSIKWRQDRRYTEFRTWYEKLHGEVTDLREDAFRESGTMVKTVVLKLRKPGESNA